MATYIAEIQIVIKIRLEADDQRRAEMSADDWGDDPEKITVETGNAITKSIEVVDVYPEPK